MSKFTPKKMMWVGAGLLVIGAVLPFLMVIQVVEPTFFLVFFSHGCSIIGMFLGFYGIFSHVRIGRK